MNVSGRDALVRVWTAVGLLIVAVDLYAIFGVTPLWWLGFVPGGLAVAMLATATTRTCPVYGVLRVSTDHSA